MKEKQISAIDWLKEEIFDNNDIPCYVKDIIKVDFETAKEIEKKNMKKLFHAGSAYTIGSHKDFKQIHPNFGEYYNQNFN